MGQREPGIIPAAEWGEKPRETVTVKSGNYNMKFLPL